ncbi:MAG: D-cysteine desulfhydrase [Woeseiaceae bacterium]|nr:D-cysteine desulfhydrase [Woeseiaceae bacterium]
MLLANFPRVSLAHLPTPLELLPRLSEYLGGPEIWVKRDDCTGLATGGNKTRKLEFSMAQALEEGATTIITVGAVQSNHVRQTAAAACKLGMECQILLEHRIADPGDLYRNSGNVLLDRLFGATLHEYPNGTDFDSAMTAMAEDVRAAGGVPYIVPGGASNRVGALGYVGCVEELLQQSAELDVEFDHLITASGSAGTHAGLVAGLRAGGNAMPILGIGVGAPHEEQVRLVVDLATETADYLGKPGCVVAGDIVVDCNYIGPGYGQRTEAMNEAVVMLARQEGLLLDPVYTGKALAGMIDYIRRGRFTTSDRIVFLHTGGAVGLFAYGDQLELS